MSFPDLLLLPDDLLTQVLLHASPAALLSFGCVCRRTRRTATADGLWRELVEAEFGASSAAVARYAGGVRWVHVYRFVLLDERRKARLAVRVKLGEAEARLAHLEQMLRDLERESEKNRLDSMRDNRSSVSRGYLDERMASVSRGYLDELVALRAQSIKAVSDALSRSTAEVARVQLQLSAVEEQVSRLQRVGPRALAVYQQRCARGGARRRPCATLGKRAR